MPNNCVLTVSGDRMLRHWQLQNKTLLTMTTTPSDSSNAFVVSPDGTLLITGKKDGLICLTNITTQTPLPSFINHGKENRLPCDER